MKKKFTMLAALALFAGATSIFAQVAAGPDGYLHCGTDQAMAEVFATHPEIKAEWEAREQQAAAQDALDFQNHYHSVSRSSGGNSVQSPPTYIIPIVFHIIHDYGSENISDAQVLDEVRILNNDYRKLNADTSAIRSAFLGIAADASIEFRLANIDPNGNCTNGIDRVYSTETYIGDDGSKLNYWNRSKYLNVWVVKTISSGAAGYAYLPGTAPSASTDGILILSTYIGSIGTGNSATSRALTHEIGHFLNLQHVWGNTNNPGVSCGNDNVSDTPVTKGWTTCPSSANAKVCNANIEENVQNYMEYSYCSNMFTAGQVTRMHNALNSATGQRSSLVTAATATATGINNSPPDVCKPTADFMPLDKQFVCAGGSIYFDDISWNGHPTSWNWSFPGGTPSTSTDSMPVIQYNTPGVYDVTMTVANASGSSSVTRTSHVVVYSTTAQYSGPTYSEGLENATTFNNDWTIINPQSTSNAWTRITTTAATGSASIKLTNTTSMTGQVDEFVSPTIDLSSFVNPVFTFKVAFAQHTSTDSDKLRVLISTNCGQTWSQRYLKIGTNLATVSAQSGAFTPTSASQWRTETVSISSVLSAPNIRIKFEFTSQGGNNIYIDDINISGAVGIQSPESGVNHFDVFPNPAQDNTNVSVSLAQNQNVSLDVVDMTGRSVMEVYQGELSAGDHTFPIQAEGVLSKGVYFVRLTTSEGRMVTQKMIVE
jgi:PKD repeat protein